MMPHTSTVIQTDTSDPVHSPTMPSLNICNYICRLLIQFLFVSTGMCSSYIQLHWANSAAAVVRLNITFYATSLWKFTDMDLKYHIVVGKW